MNLTPQFREQLVRIGGEILAAEFENMMNTIMASWRVEHDDDDTHGNVTVGTIKELGRSAGIGYWADVAHNAADYTGSGGMTWGVDPADMITFHYTLVGKTLFLAGVWNNTSVTAPLGTTLFVRIPGGFVARKADVFTSFGTDNGVVTATRVFTSAGSDLISILRLDAANWAASVNNSNIRVGMFFEIL